ncbi:WD40-repeat-containing domain protein, partial [Boletus edulis]
QVIVWNAESSKKVNEFGTHHQHRVCAIDVSPDATRIVTGSFDFTARVWSLSTGQPVLDHLDHYHPVIATRFSPNGCLIATATADIDSVRVYDSRNGHILVDFPLEVGTSTYNQSLAWTSDGNRLFALPADGIIHCLDVSTKTTQWRIHTPYDASCIALARNGTFVAVSVGSSVSFWDTTTHEQIGPTIHHSAKVACMAISSHYALATGGGVTITLRSLRDMLPPSYVDGTPLAWGTRDKMTEIASLSLPTASTLDQQGLPIQLAESRRNADQERENLSQSLRELENSSSVVKSLALQRQARNSETSSPSLGAQPMKKMIA